MSTSAIIFQTILLIAVFLCNIVFGEMLVFQTVVMPGIAKLDDGAYLRAFQVIDGIIQDNEPIFVFVWIGSVVAIVITAICGVVLSDVVDSTDDVLNTWQLAGLMAATFLWLVCQKVTFGINVPLNNRVKLLDVARMKSEEKALERSHFEPTWLKWHGRRTVLFALSSFYLLVLLLVMN